MSIIKHNWNANQLRLMLQTGMPYGAVLPKGGSVNLASAVSRIRVQIPGTQLRQVSPKQQRTFIDNISKNILAKPFTLVISSYPSDVKAKQVAAHLLSIALRQYFKQKRTINKGGPRWMNIYSSFDNSWMDKGRVNPSLVVLNNVTDNATPHKIEKLRDMLTYFDAIPRIVVTSSIDPLTFSLTTLKIRPTGVLYLSPEDKVSGL